MTRHEIGIIIAGLLFIAFGLAALFLMPEKPVGETTLEETATTTDENIGFGQPQVVGRSVEGRPIEAYRFGTGEKDILFVGGMHGGYEWNSILLAYEIIDRLTDGTIAVPAGITVHVIPNLNPDGTFAVTGVVGRFTDADLGQQEDTSIGRFNANAVDLNRNFDCKWQSESTWRGAAVKAGSSPFSEPEAMALRDYVLTNSIEAAVFWHSQSDAVYASECEAGVLPDTLRLMDTYARAADYRTVEVFDAYPITGDAEGWLASIGIPAITVEFATHADMDLEQNLAGVKAVLDNY